jgi:hypothetical protein
VKNNIFNNKFLAILVILIIVGVVVSVTTKPQVLLAPSYEKVYTNELNVGESYTSYENVLKYPNLKQAYDMAYGLSPEIAENFVQVMDISLRCPGVRNTFPKSKEEKVDLIAFSTEMNDEIDKCDSLSNKEKAAAHEFVNSNIALKKGGMGWVGSIFTCGFAAIGAATGHPSGYVMAGTCVMMVACTVWDCND